MWQAADVSIQSFVLVERLNRYSPPHPRTDNLTGKNACFRSNHRSALHENVIAKSNLAADDAIIFDGDAAADPGLRGNHDALADVTVVPDMDHVVELRPFANSRATERASIYRRVRPQFDVVFDKDGADLWKFVIAHVAANVTKAVGANRNSRMQDDTATDGHPVFNENIRMDNAVRADGDVVADFCAGANLCAVANRRTF